MAYSDNNLLTDAGGLPIPQYFNVSADNFEAVHGSSNAVSMRVEDGNSVAIGAKADSPAGSDLTQDYTVISVLKAGVSALRGLAGHWFGAWSTGVDYPLNAKVSHGGDVYIATVAHTSASATEPGVGASWADVWDVYPDGGASAGVTGPGGSTDRAIATWNGSGGNTLRNTGVTIDASNNLTVPGVLEVQSRLFVTGNTAPASGTGVLLGYDSGTEKAALTAFGFGGGGYKTLRYNALSHVWEISGVEKARLDGDVLFINDTSNANMTQGLTINQGANDDEILAFKSSDVAHGMTAKTETDSFAAFGKISATTGGLLMSGLSSGTRALHFRGFHTTDNTAKTTAADGAIMMVGALKSGTSDTDIGADGNILVIRNRNTTRFIFDAEGDAHADVSWTTFDDKHDLAVIEDMETLLAGSAVQRQFGEVVAHDRDFFEKEGLLHDIREEDGKMRGMFNTTRGLMLSFGAHRQMGGVLMELIRLNPDLKLGPKAQQLLS